MILRFTKLGAGSRTGRDWANAAELSSLAGRLRLARADDAFLVGFDRDREDPVFYSGNSIVLSASGAPDKPIRLEVGYIGDELDVQPKTGPGRHIFFQNPAATTRRRAAINGGGRYLTIDSSASHLRLTGFRVEGAPADGFFKFEAGREKGAFNDIVFQGIGATNVGRAIECSENTVINNLTIEDCDAAQLSRGFARFRSLNDSILRNIFLDAGDVDGGAMNICELIHIEAGKNVVFENLVMRGAMNLVASGTENGSSYAQGDGIVTESGTTQFAIRNCHSSGMGDGGFDLKTVGVRLEDCSAYGCKFGVRIWSDAPNRIQRCAIGNPRMAAGTRGACIQIGGRVDVIDCQLQAGQGAMIFSFNGEREAPNRVIRVFGGAIRMEGGAALLAGAAHGTLELKDVAVNGVVRNQTYAYAGKELF